MPYYKILFVLLYMCINNFQSAAQCNKIYTKADKAAEFIGGKHAWKLFLERSILLPDSMSIDELPGCLLLRFEFVVDKAGKITEVKFLESNFKNDVLIATIKEKLLKTKWTPALLNKRKVCFKHTQFINMRLAV